MIDINRGLKIQWEAEHGTWIVRNAAGREVGRAGSERAARNVRTRIQRQQDKAHAEALVGAR